MEALQHAPERAGPHEGVDRSKASARHRDVEVGVARLGVVAVEQHELDTRPLERRHDVSDEALSRICALAVGCGLSDGLF